MTPPTNSRRLAILVLALLISLFGLAYNLSNIKEGWTGLALKDFVEYWSAAQLLASGQNPYDPEKITELNWIGGRDPNEGAVLMWNPPWTLPFVLPMGYLSARTGHLVWILIQIAVLILASEILWQYYDGRKDRRISAVAITLTFIPTWTLLIMGQISALVLLGLALFLVLIDQKKDFLAGVAASLIGIKPHLVWLFWIVLLLWVIQTGRRRVIFGGVLTGVALVAIAMIWRPTVIQDYLATITPQKALDTNFSVEAGNLSHYKSPTLGMLLRMTMGEKSSFAWQFAPMVPGFLWVVWYWRNKAETWEWSREMPLIILVSALTAAYGAWLFDLVIHLVPVMAVFATLSRQQDKVRRLLVLSIFLVPNGVILYQIFLGQRFHYFVWFTPCMLLCYLAFCSLSEERQGQASPSIQLT